VFGNKKKQEQAINLVQSGAAGVGTLVDVADTGVTINELDIRIKLRFRIDPVDGSAPFEGHKTTTVSRVRIPPVGARYPVFFDPADHETFAYVDGVSDDSGRQLILSKFGDAFGPDASGVGMVGVAAPAAPAADDPLDRLKKLGELRDAGVLTEDEFSAQKAEIMGSA
jgi:putative oligomerization/nucleic acid binding protein